MGSTEPRAVSDLVRAAAAGELPEWTRASAARREHMRRVAGLMADWAAELGLPGPDRARWAAAGWLHDALKEADPEELREMVPPELRDMAPALLHGPAAAERLKGDADEAMLDAIRYHTIGHPRLDRIGRALYLADFVEPGRKLDPEWLASLRARMPEEMDDVLPAVVRARIDHMRRRGQPIRPETTAFRDSLEGGG